MQIELSLSEKEELEKQRKKERDGRMKDRIKAVLLHAEGWTQVQIAQALRVRVETVQNHLNDWLRFKKLKPENGGSQGLLTSAQASGLITHLEQQTYVSVREICAYVSKMYGVVFTVSGMTQWLHRHKFSYKQPAATHAKADPEAQAAFISFYKDLHHHLPSDEPLLFGDGVHPTMATKIAYGWIRQGVRKPILTTASRIRMNLFGAINLETMDLTIASYERINSEAMSDYFQKLRERYPKAPLIHLIIDQGPYNISAQTKEAARRCGIVLHYLPTYSPNLNPSERVWKVMNEKVRNNRFFENAGVFREAIMSFFYTTWPSIAHPMVDRINDNFQTLKQVSST